MSDPIDDDTPIPGYDTDDDQDGRKRPRHSAYTCLGCGDKLPAGRGGHCDACVEWKDAPRILVPAIRTTAREWLAEDRTRDALARMWSQGLLEKKGAA